LGKEVVNAQAATLCSEQDRKTLEEWARSRTQEARLVERGKIILHCGQGQSVSDIARRLSVRPNTVIDWRRRFEREGVTGLADRPRPGKPRRYGAGFRKQVLAVLEESPPKGQAVWDGPAVARHLQSSVHAVWRVLHKEGVCLRRQRSWCVSTDPEFTAKAAEIVGLYLNPPEKALVISVDEKPSIQALERASGYVETDNGKIVRGFQSTYKRHGTLNLFAALEVATGAIHTPITQRKRRLECLDFMDHLMAEMPVGKDIHVILDNDGIQQRNDPWLAAHPNVVFHFTPTSASWLNQVEIWFGLLARKALKGASFRNIEA
jgi:transposase